MSIEAIKEALKAGPTSAYIKHFIYDEKWQENIEFAKACNPAAIRSLIERLEAAEKDAARYRLLRSKIYVDPKQAILRIKDTFLQSGPVPEMLDAAIDSAMSGGLAEGVE